MQAESYAVNDPASLVEQLGHCLRYADREEDHVLAALISTAHEVAMARLAQAGKPVVSAPLDPSGLSPIDGDHAD